MTKQYSVRIEDKNEEVLAALRQILPGMIFGSKATLINLCIEYIGIKLRTGEYGGPLQPILDSTNLLNPETYKNFDNSFDNNILI